jgi:chromosomal replication initiation ATPase DnaA
MIKPIVLGGVLSPEADSLWQSVASRLREKISSELFNTWIMPLGFKIDYDGSALIEAPDMYLLRFLDMHFTNDIEELLYDECQKRGMFLRILLYSCRTEALSLYQGDTRDYLKPSVQPDPIIESDHNFSSWT